MSTPKGDGMSSIHPTDLVPGIKYIGIISDDHVEGFFTTKFLRKKVGPGDIFTLFFDGVTITKWNQREIWFYPAPPEPLEAPLP